MFLRERKSAIFLPLINGSPVIKHSRLAAARDVQTRLNITFIQTDLSEAKLDYPYEDKSSVVAHLE